jgi:hypothetical protein
MTTESRTKYPGITKITRVSGEVSTYLGKSESGARSAARVLGAALASGS